MRDSDEVIHSIEAECLCYLPSKKSSTILQATVVAALDIFGIAISRPPGDHLRRWLDARTWCRCRSRCSCWAIQLGAAQGTIGKIVPAGHQHLARGQQRRDGLARL